MNLNNIIDYPETIDEAVSRLIVILSDREKEQIKALPEDELFSLHFSLGKDIRNSFGLNSGNTVLLGNRSADDVSMDIIKELWGDL